MIWDQLTDDVQAGIVEKLSIGASRESAAAAMGVSPALLAVWLAAGKRAEAMALAGKTLDATNERALTFWRAVVQAEGQAESDYATVIFNEAQRNAELAKWWLSRQRTGETLSSAPDTPHQQEGRTAYEKLKAGEPIDAPWWEDYVQLRAEGWDCNKAVYIAWAASPSKDRWPATQRELAQDFLGLTDRTIRNWRKNDPKIDDRVARLQAEPLLRYRRDVIETLAMNAATPDPRFFPDRQLFLKITGDYKERASLAIDGQVGMEHSGQVQVVHDLSGLTDEELDILDQITAKLAGQKRKGEASPD